MDSMAALYLEKSENEFIFSKASFNLSINIRAKEILSVPKNKTFFSNVISSAYYSIFYCAKSYLLSKGIKTSPPEEHKKTYEEFRAFAETGILDSELFEIYHTEICKAESLLSIFSTEKRKRIRFTYNINSSANLPYAKESIENARKFISSIKAVLRKSSS